MTTVRFWPGQAKAGFNLFAEKRKFIGRTHSLRAYGSARCIAAVGTRIATTALGRIRTVASPENLNTHLDAYLLVFCICSVHVCFYLPTHSATSFLT